MAFIFSQMDKDIVSEQSLESKLALKMKMVKSICPIFARSDFEKTSVFYRGLGFNEVARFEEQGYLILVRDTVEIHFFSTHDHETSQTSDHDAFVQVEDAQALSSEYEKLDMSCEFEKADNKHWGVCELEIIDPDGNLLRMGDVSADS
ncbi:hypothetical protein GCM10009096_01800 [Parasphingorhabdus litoris]|uniref:Bleomycin resistance protein n=1 Tax=Parasphingorhabdus litoris TaxID=394733 RepID=A0ABN1A0Z0_9SPHN|nr:VOC family protein [Parasphingorhabdus litoris]